MKKAKKRTFWQSSIRLLSLAVFFCTVYMMVLPAISVSKTGDKLTCPMEEHIHTAECYSDLPVMDSHICDPHQEAVELLECVMESLGLAGLADLADIESAAKSGTEKSNTATSSTAGIAGQEAADAGAAGLVAGTDVDDVEIDFSNLAAAGKGIDIGKAVANEITHVVPDDEDVPVLHSDWIDSIHILHTHNEYCYGGGDEDGEADSDLDKSVSGSGNPGKLICLLEEVVVHEHDSSCYRYEFDMDGTESKILHCPDPALSAHIHDKDCLDISGNLVCSRPVAIEHEHTVSCFARSEDLICDLEEYTHSESCYESISSISDEIHGIGTVFNPDGSVDISMSVSSSSADLDDEDNGEEVSINIGRETGKETETDRDIDADSGADSGAGSDSAAGSNTDSGSDSGSGSTADDSGPGAVSGGDSAGSTDTGSGSGSSSGSGAGSAAAVSSIPNIYAGYAGTTRKDLTGYITSIQASVNGEVLDNESDTNHIISSSSSIDFKINYTLPPNTLKDNAVYFCYELSGNFTISSGGISGDVYKASGEKVGIFSIVTGEDGKNYAYITFTDQDFIDGNIDTSTTVGSEISGFLNFTLKANAMESDDLGNTTLTFGTQNGDVTVNIQVPGKEIVSEEDLKVEKFASTPSSDGVIVYTIRVSSKNGTAGEVKVSDTVINAILGGENGDGNFNFGSLSPEPAVNRNNGNSWELTLPQMSAGQVYTFTYEVKADANVNTSVEVSNTVNVSSVRSDGALLKDSASTKTALQRTHIRKYANTRWDGSKLIDWTIVINEAGLDIGGFTLSDPMFSEAIGDITITPDPDSHSSGSAVLKLKDDNTYTFPAGSASTYTVSFTTAWSDISLGYNGIDNTAYLYKGDESYAGSATAWINNYSQDALIKSAITNNDIGDSGDEDTGGDGESGGSSTGSTGSGSGSASSGAGSSSAGSAGSTSQPVDYTYIDDSGNTVNCKTVNMTWSVKIHAIDGTLHPDWSYEDQLYSCQYQWFTWKQILEIKNSVDAALAKAGLDLSYDFILEPLIEPDTRGNPVNFNTASSNENIDAYSSRRYKAWKLVFHDALERGESFEFTYSSTSRVDTLTEKYSFINEGVLKDSTGSISDKASQPYIPTLSDFSISKVDMRNQNGGDQTNVNYSVIYDKDLDADVLKWKLIVTIPASYIGDSITITDTLPEGLSLSKLRMQFSNSAYNKDSGWYGLNLEKQEQNVGGKKLNLDIDNNDIRFTIPKESFYSISDPELDTKIQIEVYAMIDEKIDWILSESEDKYTISYTNTMSVMDSNNNPLGSAAQTQTVVRPVPNLLAKNSSLDSNNTIEYTLTINPDGDDLLENGELLTLIDTLSYSYDPSKGAVNVSLVPNSVELYSVDRAGNQASLDLNTYKYSYSETRTTEDTGMVQGRNILNFTVPDETRLILKYKYHVTGNTGTSISVKNGAALSGISGKNSSTSTVRSFSIQQGNAGANLSSIGFLKVDADNAAKHLPGVRFQLQVYVPDGNTDSSSGSSSGTWQKIGNAFTSDNSGEFTVSVNLLEENKAYRLQEVETASGYILGEDFYFYLSSSDGMPKFPSGISARPVMAGQTIYITNEKQTMDLKILKIWRDQSGKDVTSTKTDGSVTYELFRKIGSATRESAELNIDYVQWYDKDIKKSESIPNADFSNLVEGSQVTITLKGERMQEYCLKLVKVVKAEGCSVISQKVEYVQDNADKNNPTYSAEWTIVVRMESGENDLMIQLNNVYGYLTSYGVSSVTAPVTLADQYAGIEEKIGDEFVITGSSNTGWTYTHPEMEKYPKDDKGSFLKEPDGKKMEYVYYVVEKNVNGYTSVVDSSRQNHGIITMTNTETGEQYYVLPQTGGTGSSVYRCSGLFLAAAACLAGGLLKRKKHLPGQVIRQRAG